MFHNNVEMEFMRRAITLGEKGRNTAPPNPWVGCVIVKRGNIVGEGFHRAPGEPHAEIVALLKAMGDAEGADFYITLEPCTHYGRTPPCVEEVIKAKPKRVFIGTRDPDEKVSGRGIARLKAENIEVVEGTAESEVVSSLRSYLHHRKTGQPYCLAKVAASADGRIAARDGTSQWITSPEARADAHNLRAESQAIVIGCGTALKDKPRLTARHSHYENPKQPLRVILDSKGSLSPPSPLLDVSEAPTLIVTSSLCPMERRMEWSAIGVEVMIAPLCPKSGKLEWPHILKELAQRGVLQLMVEGGAKIHTSLMRDKLINNLVMYIGPKLIGSEGIPFLHQLDISSMQKACKLNLSGIKKLGDTVRLDYVF